MTRSDGDSCPPTQLEVLEVVSTIERHRLPSQRTRIPNSASHINTRLEIALRMPVSRAHRANAAGRRPRNGGELDGTLALSA